jgi:hypothetical protein
MKNWNCREEEIEETIYLYGWVVEINKENIKYESCSFHRIFYCVVYVYHHQNHSK